MDDHHAPASFKLSSYLLKPICITNSLLLEAQLLLLALATGIQDACTYPSYLCFASNQTGNTVLLAIGATGLLAADVLALPNIAVSLALFVAGSLLAGQIGNRVGSTRRIWLLVSSVVQTACVWGATGLSFVRESRGQRTGPEALAVLALLAFAAGAQVAMARGVRCVEITTAMATAAYVDLLVDPRLWHKNNRSRNRRAAFLISLALGAFAGAYISKEWAESGALLVSAVLKTLGTLFFLLNQNLTDHSIELGEAKLDEKKEEIVSEGMIA